VTAIASGALPTWIGVPVPPVARSIGVTVPAPKLATYAISGPAPGPAGAGRLPDGPGHGPMTAAAMAAATAAAPAAAMTLSRQPVRHDLALPGADAAASPGAAGLALEAGTHRHSTCLLYHRTRQTTL
jgi:hypothetical protein